MQGRPPSHQRFKNTLIPTHITYAYKEGVTILKNDDFYTLPDAGTKQIDLLFVMANAPVNTASMPEGGSQAYVGLAKNMELALNELSEIFPAFFVEEAEPREM